MAAPEGSATPGGYDVYKFIDGAHSESELKPSDAPTTSAAIVDRDVPARESAKSADPTELAADSHAQAGNILERVDSPQDLPDVAERKMFPLEGDAGAAGTDTSMRSPLVTEPGQITTKKADMAGEGAVERSTYGTTVDSRSNTISENAPSVQRDKESAGKDPKPDMVLVFNLPKRDADPQEWREADQEYDRLKRTLSEAGFRTAATPGRRGQDERLVLVRAGESLVRAEAQSEKLSDWLDAVKGPSARHDPRSPRDFHRFNLTSAERIRHVCSVMRRSLHSDETDQPFPRLDSYFPPHDKDFDSEWLKNWSGLSISIPERELTRIKDNFGEDIALYFQFLRYYFVALAVPTFIGLSTWLGGHHFSKLYSIILVLWSVCFVEGWRLREKQISVRWGSYGISQRGPVRLGFKAESTVQSSVTGQSVPYSPWWKRELRVTATIPALLGFSLVLAAVITLIFFGEVIINEVYAGPGKQFLSLVPTIFFAGLVPQVVGLWFTTAKQLTSWENHPTEVSHERSLTFKMFALNAIASYGALTLTAYVYLPFASFLVPYIVSGIRGRISTESVSAGSLSAPSTFSASTQRLTNTLFALMTTTQAVGAFTEVGLPFLQRKLAEKRNEQANETCKDVSMKGELLPKDRKDQNWLERIRSEVALPSYDIFSDYSEMVVQFGHVVLFSTAWPLAPLAAFVNNFFELRGDAFKLCVNSRRPVPRRADSIGPWLDTLSWITYLGALTNASLIYLLRPHSRDVQYSDVKALSTHVGQPLAHGNVTIGTNPNPGYTSTRIGDTEGDLPRIRSILLGALLCALASEHAFLLARRLIRHLLDMLVWRGSEEESTLRRSEWLLKNDYVEAKGVSKFEQEIDRLHSLTKKETHSENQFDIWNENDKGIKEELEKKDH